MLVHGCEDCACAVTSERPTKDDNLSLVASGESSIMWSASRTVLDDDLGGGYRMLFNPLGSGGVVVVDEPAHAMFRAFDPAASFGEVGALTGHDEANAATLLRLAELDLIHPADQPQRPAFQQSQVLTAWLHVTNACNLRCPYCYISKSDDPMDETTGRAAVRAVIESAVRHGFSGVRLKYAGGEASMNHRLMVTLHRYARDLAATRGLDLQAVMLSNGVAVSAALADTLATEGIRVMISLDGVGEQHDAQRPALNGGPSFRMVERGISRLLERGHAPHLSITITARNIEGLSGAVRFALERDLTFSLNLYRDNDCASAFTDLRYEEHSLISGMLAAFAVIEERMPRWSVLGSILDRGQLLEPRQRSCGVGQDYVVIDQHGQVAKCHMEIERTIGDVFSADPLDLVRRDTTTALNLIVDEKEGCRDCSWRYWCTGGCTVATFRATGRYDVKSPNCNIYRAIYPEALRLEARRLLKFGI
jgi:uncharacterized protein